jgi:hypothetical protein
MSDLVSTKPKWCEQWGISKEAADALWEIAASIVLEIEDRTHQEPSRETVWKELNKRHPDWYPSRPPHTLRDHWWNNPQWKQYLAIRRQEHLIRTMPARLQIQRYYGHMQKIFSDMLLERAMNSPDTFTNAQLLSILKEVNSALMEITEYKKKAAGEETEQRIQVNVFEFLEKMPRDRQNAIIGKLVREKVRPAIGDGDGD